MTPELTKTVERLASLLPRIAAVFGVSAKAGAPTPKPLRPTKPVAKKIPPKPAPASATAPAVETPAVEAPAVEAPAVEANPVEAPEAVDAPATDSAD